MSAYPLTYYADTVDPAAASPIVVTEGSTASIHVTLQAVPAIHVQLTGFESRPDAGVNAMAYVAGPGGFPIAVNAPTATVNNAHELMGLPPGRYQLSVQAWNRGQLQIPANDYGQSDRQHRARCERHHTDFTFGTHPVRRQ